MASCSAQGCGEGTVNKRKADDDGDFSPKVKREESDDTKIKQEKEEEVEDIPEASEPTYQETKVKKYRIDSVLSSKFPESVIHEDFACMLNQTNIDHNNNKFYIIQVAKDKKSFLCFTRWGRVGKQGQHKVDVATNVDGAIKAFKKKFKDKTRNNWDEREKFFPMAGKYTLIEIDEDDEENTVDSALGVKEETTPIKGRCNLPIKDEDDEENTVDSALGVKEETAPIQDVRNMPLEKLKMPLGKLSKNQIKKGLKALIDIEEAISNNELSEDISKDLSSKFYSLIPHDFGMKIPTLLDTDEIVKEKKEVVMLTLSNMGH